MPSPNPNDEIVLVGPDDDDAITIVGPDSTTSSPKPNALVVPPGSLNRALMPPPGYNNTRDRQVIGHGVSRTYDQATDPKNRPEILSALASMASSIAAPPTIPLRLGAAILPPTLAAIGGKMWGNAEEDKPVWEGVDSTAKEHLAWNSAFAAGGETLRGVAGVFKRKGSAGSAFQQASRQIGDLDATAQAKGAQLGPPKMPEELGGMIHQTTVKSNEVGKAISSKAHETLYKKVKPVDATSLIEEIRSLPESIRGDFGKKIEASIEADIQAWMSAKMKSGVPFDYTRDAAEIAKVQKDAAENAFRNLSFEEFDDLTKKIGASTRLPLSSGLMAGINTGDMQRRYALFKDVLELTAKKTRQAKNYTDMKDYHRELGDLFDSDAIGGTINAKVQLDPQKVADEVAGSAKRMEAYQRIVKLVQDPKASKFITPEELKSAEESLKAFNRHYHDTVLMKDGVAGLTQTLAKEGKERVVQMYAGAAPVKDPAVAKIHGEHAFEELQKLAKTADDIQTSLAEVKKDNALMADIAALTLKSLPGTRSLPAGTGFIDSILRHATEWVLRKPETAIKIGNILHSGKNATGIPGVPMIRGIGDNAVARRNVAEAVLRLYYADPEGRAKAHSILNPTQPPPMPQP